MYPHLPGVLPPNLQQQLLFQQMQQTYGQMQQQAQVYGGAPPQQINLQLQQPTMQMQPLPVQQSYTRKPRGRNAIRIINPDTGDEVKVDSGASEPPQVPTPPVVSTPALTTSSVGVSGTESSLSSTRGGAPEEFRRKVAQAANSEPRLPPPPNAIIRDPNNPKLGSSEPPPIQPVSEETPKLQPPESEKTSLEPPTDATLTAPVPTPAPALTPTPAHMGTPVAGDLGSTDETGVVVSQEENLPPQSEAVDSVEGDSSRPSEAIQPERGGESAEKLEGEETKHTEEARQTEEITEARQTEEITEARQTEEITETVKGGPDSTQVTGPSPLVTEGVESATGEKSAQDVELEGPVQPVQQEKPVSVPAEEDLQIPHPPSENISEPFETPNSSSVPESQDTVLTSAPPPVHSTEEPPVPGTKPEIPPATEDKRSNSEAVVAAVASETETITDVPTSETADSLVPNDQNVPDVEGVSSQEIQPHSGVVVPSEPPGQESEEQSSAPAVPESSRTEVAKEDQSGQPVIGEDADGVGRTDLPEVQDRQEENRTEAEAPAEPVPEVRMRDEKTGESLAAVSETGELSGLVKGVRCVHVTFLVISLCCWEYCSAANGSIDYICLAVITNQARELSQCR